MKNEKTTFNATDAAQQSESTSFYGVPLEKTGKAASRFAGMSSTAKGVAGAGLGIAAGVGTAAAATNMTSDNENISDNSRIQADNATSAENISKEDDVIIDVEESEGIEDAIYDDNLVIEVEDDNTENSLSVVVDEAPCAKGVTDDMSFSEAFSKARAEVGPGGVFEWNGNLYGTYYEEEWNAMSAEEKAEYYKSVNWETTSKIEVGPGSEEVDDDLVEIDVEPTSEDITVEVLGVEQSEDGSYVAGVNVDGQDMFLIDVDGDMQFDYICSDVNGDQQLSEDEVADISSENIHVQDLAGSNDYYAANDLDSSQEPDYVNDALV